MNEVCKNAIELRNVSRSFGDFSLRDISLTLPSGSILGLIGENGAGKSTTIRLIMNSLRRDSGDIRVLGASNTSPEFLAVKEDIGVVLDEAYFPEPLTMPDRWKKSWQTLTSTGTRLFTTITFKNLNCLSNENLKISPVE